MTFQEFSTKAHLRIRRLTWWLAAFGMVPFFMMLAITTVDVIGAKLFSRPVPGGPEVVAVLQALAISSAAGFLQVTGGHTQIDFFVFMLPNRLRSLMAIFIQVLLILFFMALCWNSFLVGASLQASGEVSSSARIPLYIPAYYMALCFIVVNLALLAEMMVQLTGLKAKS